MRKMIGVGLIGMGVVGSGVARTIVEKSDVLSGHVGLPLQVTGVAVKDISKQRPFQLSSGILGNDPQKIVNDDSVPHCGHSCRLSSNGLPHRLLQSNGGLQQL